MEKKLPPFDFPSILSQFDIQEISAIEPYGSGHINDSFRLTTIRGGQTCRYLLQRINHAVFKDVPALMRNIDHVTTHLRNKYHVMRGPTAAVLTLVPTNHGKYFIQDVSGNYWRVFHFLENAHSYDLVKNTRQAEAGGKAFGQFQALLVDLPASTLTDTIPDFHNIEKRLLRFRDVLIHDGWNRASEVAAEIQFVEARSEAMGTILRWGAEGKLPLRITHNDTKFNNVLLDEDDHALCVIDLDTVMPGYIAYDFGDAIRTLVNTAPEDEKNTERINVNVPLFEAFTRGYLQETSSFITAWEIESLSRSVLLLPYIMGVRFLTDYLEGNIYYKTSFPGHNLQRCRAQFQLIRKLEEQYPVLQNIINRMAERYMGNSFTAGENKTRL